MSSITGRNSSPSSKVQQRSNLLRKRCWNSSRKTSDGRLKHLSGILHRFYSCFVWQEKFLAYLCIDQECQWRLHFSWILLNTRIAKPLPLPMIQSDKDPSMCQSKSDQKDLACRTFIAFSHLALSFLQLPVWRHDHRMNLPSLFDPHQWG